MQNEYSCIKYMYNRVLAEDSLVVIEKICARFSFGRPGKENKYVKVVHHYHLRIYTGCIFGFHLRSAITGLTRCGCIAVFPRSDCHLISAN